MVSPPALGSLAVAATLTAGGALSIERRLGLSNDIKFVLRERHAQKLVTEHVARYPSKSSLYNMLERCNPEAEALWFEGRVYLYKDVQRLSTQFACLLQDRGISTGDTVALFMTNCPELYFAIFAVAQLGAVPALINYALKADTLAHALNISNAKLAITTPELSRHLRDIMPENQTMAMNFGTFPADGLQDSPGITDVNAMGLLRHLGRPKPVDRSLQDIGAIMFTSGTTGKPKAVSIKNFMFAAISSTLPEDLVAADRPPKQRRTFVCLPLFHGTGFFGGIVALLSNSGCCCLVRSFSASQFSRQLTESNATRLMYVGEICRYMLAAPPSKYDRAHHCTIAWGNGLQEDVWNAFRERFGIQQIREFYGSTEGSAKFDNYLNLPGGEGKIGFLGALGRRLENNRYIIKVDAEGSPVRDPVTGFCIKTVHGETGEAIGRVQSLQFFHEYLQNKEATEAKLIRDVFEKGDLFQRTGDLLVHERSGWIRFSDRAGDTFRWNGENVSAGELRSFILQINQVKDVVVYSTKLTGYGGQAGCAAIVTKSGSSEEEKEVVDSLYATLDKHGLIKAGFPRLVRFMKSLPSTATFKHVRTELTSHPWNPALNHAADHHLYWLRGTQYEPLTEDAWARIATAKARL